MRAAIYARVSTWDQNTLPIQIRDCSEFIKARGWDLVITEAENASGANARPKREKIITLARQRKIDVVLVWKLDRWGRSVSDVTSNLEELRLLGVAFVSINEAIDFTTPIGKAMGSLLAVFAELERDFLKERVKAGIDEARRKGRAIGRPAIEQKKIDSVVSLWVQKKTISEISREMSISRRTVSRIVNSDVRISNL